SPARGHGLQLVERFGDELRQFRLAGSAVPAFERDLEDGYPRLGGQARGRFGDATLAQRLGQRRGERGELDQLSLLEASVGGDDRLTLPGVLAALLEQGTGGLQGRGDRLDRRRGRRRPGEGADHELPQCARAREKHLALV